MPRVIEIKRSSRLKRDTYLKRVAESEPFACRRRNDEISNCMAQTDVCLLRYSNFKHPCPKHHYKFMLGDPAWDMYACPTCALLMLIRLKGLVDGSLEIKMVGKDPNPWP